MAGLSFILPALLALSQSTPVDTLEAIEVEGARVPTEDPIAPVADVDIPLEGRPIRQEGLSEVLDELPGVQQLSLGGFGSFQQISIRGTEFDHTTVLIDDVPVAAPDRGPLDLSLLPLDGFERVELYRGSAPIRYGLGSIGAVLRLVPKEAGSRRVRGTARAGSFGLLGLSADGEGWTGDFSYSMAAGMTAAKNDFSYEDDKGTAYILEDDEVVQRDNADVVQGNAFAQAAWRHGGHRVVGFGLFVQRAQGLPGPAISLAPDARSQKTRVIGALGYRYHGEEAGSPLSGFLSASFSWDRERTRDLYSQIGLGASDSEDDYFGVEARGGVFLKLLRYAQLGATAKLRQDSLLPEDTAARFQGAHSYRDRAGLAGELRLSSPFSALPASLRASIGREYSRAKIRGVTWRGRVDKSATDSQDSYRLEGKLSPLAGLELSALYSSGSRPPTMLELFGDNALIVGAPSLKPERGETAELGLKLSRHLGPVWASVEAQLYWLWMHDLIDMVSTSQYTVTFENREQVDIRGLEGSYVLRWRALSLEGALSWMRAHFEYYGFTRERPIRAPLTIFERLSFAPRLSEQLQLGAFLELRYRSRVYADPVNLVRIPRTTLVHLGASLRLFSKLTVTASVKNLFDQRRLDVLSYPQPGRSYEINLQYQESL